MDITPQLEDEVEKKRHAHAIQTLARDMGIPVEEVNQLYEQELEKLKEYARVKDFLPLIVSRRVKDLLKGKKLSATS
jgi:hypothetical protein